LKSSIEWKQKDFWQKYQIPTMWLRISKSNEMIKGCKVRGGWGLLLIVLEDQFSGGYDEGAHVFYMSTFDGQGQVAMFTKAKKIEWGPL